MPQLPAGERSLINRANATSRWAKTPDRSEATQRWRDAFLQRLADEADPEGRLPESERLARAIELRRAHLLRASAAAARARREKKETD